MTPQLTQITRYMEDRGRLVRLTPVTGLPSMERFSQVERLVESLWDTANHLGINLGRKPTLIMTGESISPPSTLLAILTLFETEVLATFIMAGLGTAHARAVYLLATTPPGKPTPNFRTIIDEIYYQRNEDIEVVGAD